MEYHWHKKYRSILPQGKNSVAITLPRNWARKHGLNKGDQVKCTEEDGRLIIEVIK